MEREFGRIKKFFADKGYGFVRCDSGADLFVHISQTGFSEPAPGDRVSFERGINPRTNKQEAHAVAILGGSDA